jgi:protein-ribulosamine 3-kinase
MNSEFQDHISNVLNNEILSLNLISGGDISLSYKINTSKNCYFIKTNTSSKAFEMFKAEDFGLNLIHDTKTIATPTVIDCGKYQKSSYLIMEFVESKSPSSLDFENLGSKLGELHLNSSNVFGLNQNNFIGSLPQSNKQNTSWVKFYTNERLLPQLQLAKQKGLLSNNECPSEKIISEKLENLFLDVKPSLLHGDLWSGNYMISKEGTPYLIDPAIYYGDYEVDLAMSKLFGGFGESFYRAHSKYFPVTQKTSSRIEIYQLYYLMVHLNLFGKSYYDSVKSILKKNF